MKSPAIELLDEIQKHLGKSYRSIVADACGVDRTTVGRWHNDERTPNMTEGAVLYSMYHQLSGKPVGFPTYLESKAVIQSIRPTKADREMDVLMDDIKHLKPVDKSQIKLMVEFLKNRPQAARDK